jgi:hypothetical protein
MELMLTSRTVLADCQHSIELMEQSSAESDSRIHYVAAIALIRAVGHVLHKVDAIRSELLGRAVDDAYLRWKDDRSQHAIFWDFIEAERNDVLKRYEFSYRSNPHIVVQTPEVEEEFVLGDELFLPVADGPFAGEDVRDILSAAIAWWEAQLSLIETAAGAEVAKRDFVRGRVGQLPLYK